MIVTRLEAATAAEFGGKAIALAEAIRAHLPVPRGLALRPEEVERVVQGDAVARTALVEAWATLSGPVAVRSSCVGEDGAGAAFAGQHVTHLNVTSAASLLSALREVQASATAPAALAYRRRLGLDGAPRMGAVVQCLVDAERAGVLFTRCPVSGAEEMVVEASWGLGEAVVAGLVTPDRYRLDPGGAVLEVVPGEKDLAIRCAPGGGTHERPVEAEDIERPCLGPGDLQRLVRLARQCEAVFGAARDLEFAFDGDELYLLQCRPITTGGR